MEICGGDSEEGGDGKRLKMILMCGSHMSMVGERGGDSYHDGGKGTMVICHARSMRA